MSRIGFVGLGNMGKPMAKNLIKAGFSLKVFDLSPENTAALAALGAEVLPSHTALPPDVDIVFTMLPHGAAVSSVLSGPNGLFQHSRKGTLFIDCSSIEVDIARTLAEEATKTGMDMVDAPVSGGVMGAENATLTFMVGGPEAAFNRALPTLNLLGKKIVHAGHAGNGQAAKICNNMILGISMIAISEAFQLGKKLGLAPEKLFEISANASGQCWAMTSYCPVPGLVPTAPSNRNYQPGFASSMMLKDLLLSQNAAQSADAHTPLGKRAMELYRQFCEEAHGQEDFSAIYRWLDSNA